MLIPPTYLRLLDRPAEAGAEPAAGRPAGAGRPAIVLLAAATGAASGGLTAWLVLLGLG